MCLKALKLQCFASQNQHQNILMSKQGSFINEIVETKIGKNVSSSRIIQIRKINWFATESKTANKIHFKFLVLKY